ncbi:UDP-N-acetylmuramoyl-tripeptide--D-alanyl-D-alanine ligase [Aquimarina sp. U1-2]|uniref:UDP-N-acetylmuramoyl-tripeptide--D-alanyl-D- alanine ligase n=1 Tax=Aquimarina sp. U1-2 TaxID=2823141 RepID=UPI001AECCB21|nr:UDP-N-acetylmuramoyl-tripeptide--D-alanyl-D-alanine ligase [Aquimarina sp. U1-2]MBP2831006.1 UDP-N-acetylmuramoyl-tripeptide--D-alanyl-D-alanine ligase [Aquimarina sp. U1-2]
MKISQIHQIFLESKSVSTDTRNIKSNSIFFALKGEKFNGNAFADQAITLGASYAIIDEAKFKTSDKHILVDNVLTTLQQLATYHRTYLDIPIIALTGSNGKTTSKELINVVLSKKYQTTATSGNFNNHIGVPLTLLSMSRETQIGIVEMGANHQGEIDNLCAIAKPDYGYITNIGKAHLEGFGGIEGVLKGKTELYNFIRNEKGLIFLNEEDEKLKKASKGIRTFTFSSTTHTTSDCIIQLVQRQPTVSVASNDIIFNSQLTGAYNYSNIAAAITIGNYFKISVENIKSAIESYLPSNNRSQVIQKNNHTIYLDAYNANPTSMKAALNSFHEIKADHKIVIIGDMFELGSSALKEHEEIAILASQMSFERVFLIGKEFSGTSIKHPLITKMEKFEMIKDYLLHTKISNKASILIKASRGMQLERIVELL